MTLQGNHQQTRQARAGHGLGRAVLTSSVETVVTIE